VVGRLKQERWNDTNGKAQSRTVVTAEHVEFRPEFKKEEYGKKTCVPKVVLFTPDLEYKYD
jgi:single-strand DNA-binding protein